MLKKPCLSFQGLSRQFSYSWAVHDATGSFYENSSIAIVGRNGAGKSTLLHLISSIYRPTRGRLIKHCDFNYALIGHETMFYSRLTALENLIFYQKLKPTMTLKDIYSVLEFMELDLVKNEPVSSLSHGMKKKLALARMISQKPSVLFMDEPFSGLDLKGKDLLINLILKKGIPDLNWSFNGFAIIEHDLELCLKICSEFWVMDEGRLKIYGVKSDVQKSHFKKMIYKIMSN